MLGKGGACRHSRPGMLGARNPSLSLNLSRLDVDLGSGLVTLLSSQEDDLTSSERECDTAVIFRPQVT